MLKLVAVMTDEAASANERATARRALEKLLEEQEPESVNPSNWNIHPDITAAVRDIADFALQQSVTRAKQTIEEYMTKPSTTSTRKRTSKPATRMSQQEMFDSINTACTHTVLTMDADGKEQEVAIVALIIPFDVLDALDLADRKTINRLGEVIADAASADPHNDDIFAWDDFDGDEDEDEDED